jgi:poly-gamma-glutamate capsule biosynthesis protein CapA/YwtB (metallophosphatase superfamily)
MFNFNRAIFLFLAISLIYSCKTARIAQKYTSSQDSTDIIEVDSLPVTVIPEVEPIEEEEDKEAEIDTVSLIEPEDTISIIGVGDIMMGTNFPKPSYLPPHGLNLLEHVQSILVTADVTFGNLEGVILDEGGDPKECRNPDACYLFRSPEYMAGHLVEAGFDVLSIANNHTGDFGLPGRANTARVLDSLGIHFAGTTDRTYATFQIEDVNYGFAAFAPNKGTVSIHDIDGATELVQKLDSISDIVIVSFHGGAEGKDHQHLSREEETYYGENRGNVYEFSHSLVDAGADVIFGHGPHVTRAIEVYNDRFIAYSLGNFCTYARFNLRGPNGIAPIVKLMVKKNGEFISGKIYPVKQRGLGIPVIDDDRAAIFKIQELTHIDIPESKIVIDDNGIIKYLKQDF